MSNPEQTALPEGHTRLDDTNLKRLTVFGNELYWDNKPILTKLSGKAKLWVGITGALAVLATILSIWTNGHTIYGWFLKGSPPPASGTAPQPPVPENKPAQSPSQATPAPAPANPSSPKP